ncbi:acyltransferase ChoActase/COT/CPT [Syncephalis plumigaleata]|nr:acyltransferase ChoActase/COT/CPT [Syncephalis plumigaleata]
MATPVSASSTASNGTLAFQDTLPKLPVPPLEKTFALYLRSLEPIVNAEQLAITKANIADFLKPNGLGEKLQRRLLDYASHESVNNGNWLDSMWLRLAYHQWREPLLVNTIADGQCDINAHNGKKNVSLLQRWLDMKDDLSLGRYPVEQLRSGAQCMHQYYQLFGVTRIPEPGCDIIRGGGYTLMIRNQPYRVPVYTDDGQRLSDADLESQIWRAIRDLESRKTLDAPARQKLIDLSDVNVKSLHSIENSILSVSLDDFASVDKAPVSASRNSDDAITYGYQNGINTPDNRWFDKSISLVVERDGQTVRRPLTYFGPTPQVPSVENVEAPQALHFRAIRYVENTRQRVNAVSDNSDAGVLHFREYGTDIIKKMAKVSPDAFVQMALQLAYYRLHNKFAPTYETASTRMYLKGRTETVRSLSADSVAWCEAMRNPNVSHAERYRLFQVACKSHVNYMRLAAKGYGCDRHMLGLRMMLRDGEQHAVFTDSAFSESQTWRLSTSALTTGDLLLACGFGAIVEDGYGINYQARPKVIQFGIESKKSCPETGTQRFRASLTKVLQEMRVTCEAVNDATPSKSKI